VPRSAAGFGARLAHDRAINRFRILAGCELTIAKKSDCPAEPRAAREQEEDLEIIEQLLSLALEAVAKKTPDVRLADILKLLEFKHRLKPAVDAREIFWDWIERFRRDATVSGDDDEAAKDELPTVAGLAKREE
jgi:hypothetical protein